MSAMPRAEVPGHLIVLVGVDGAGKTTLSRRIGEELEDRGVLSLSHRRISRREAYAERCMTGVADLLWPRDNTTFDHLLPAEFYVFLKATWYALFSDLVLQPELEGGKTVLVDGWHYKFVAKMTLDGFSEHYLRAIFAHVVKPDLVIMLDADIEGIWDRRTDFRSHELGLHEGYSELGRQSFLDYQGKVREKLLEMANRRSWEVLGLERGISIDESYARLESLVLHWMEGRGIAAEARGPDPGDRGDRSGAYVDGGADGGAAR